MNKNKQSSLLFTKITVDEETSVMGGIGFRRWQDRNSNSLPNGIPGSSQDSFWSDLLSIPILRYLFSFTNPGLLQSPTGSYGNSGDGGFLGSLGLW